MQLALLNISHKDLRACFKG